MFLAIPTSGGVGFVAALVLGILTTYFIRVRRQSPLATTSAVLLCVLALMLSFLFVGFVSGGHGFEFPRSHVPHHAGYIIGVWYTLKCSQEDLEKYKKKNFLLWLVLLYFLLIGITSYMITARDFG